MSLVSIWVAGLLAFHGVFVSQVLDHRIASTQFFVSSAAVVLLQLLAKAADKRSVVFIRTFLYALCLISSASLMAVAVSNMSAIELPLVVAGSMTVSVDDFVRFWHCGHAAYRLSHFG